VLAACAALTLTAQPDPREIVRRAVANELGPSSEFALRYNYTERIRVKNLDSEGKTRSVLTKTHSVLLLDGSPYRILLEENGEPAPLKDPEAQQKELQRVLALRRQESAAQRERRLAEFKSRRERYDKAIREIPDAFQFRLLREELHRGRPTYLIEATPRPGYRPIDRYSRLFTQVSGRLWIDKEEGFWTRLDAELLDTVTFGWILVRIHAFSRVLMTQTRHAPGVWLPEQMWYRVSLRVGLLRYYHLEEDTLYSDYVPAQEDPRLARLR
jgi:hypothetical protein